jgi:starch phosphorylase
VRETYQEQEKWNAMAVRNIAKSGIFASDRTIGEYNQLIWWL